ncbi:carbohydrate ABC transporter permease [Solicola gregarius]|uniref:Sugar ABC transporter permease n=1 Tax=Solicola gregarius TaxID=2908642 RepID=A0AA46TI57_9ACTN|nr:sugar ABC transporter permease [Solicola gregarius]UYM05797.1 sugar ABC transporter permease [Solicola gregarius]
MTTPTTAPARSRTQAPVPEPKPRRRGRRQREGRVAPYAYLAPFFLVFAAFGLFPLIYTAWISLYDARLGSDMSWVGFENFRWLFTNPEFYNAAWKTVTIGALSTIPQLLLALGLAHLLNYGMRVRMFFRISMILPYATSVAAATLIFGQIFATDGGFANWAMSLAGIEAIDWRNGDWTAQIAISVIVIWRWTGYNALIYLAGMQTISYDLYESAALDGASKWQQFRYITLPGLRPTILFTIVVSTIGATQLFGEPLLFGGGLPNGGSTNQYQTLGLLMYQQGWQFGALGRAAAIAWVSFLLIVVLVLLNTAIARWRMRGTSLLGEEG